MQFLPVLLSGLSTTRKEIKIIQAVWMKMKTKLRVAYERLVNLKSL